MNEQTVPRVTRPAAGTTDTPVGWHAWLAKGQARVCQAARWLVRHPAASVPAAAAVTFGVLVYLWIAPPSTTRAQVAGDVAVVLIIAGIAAYVSWLAVLRVTRHQPAAGPALTLPETAPWIRSRGAAGPPCPAPPEDVAGALLIVEGILRDLRPGPEQITAADPDAFQVRWDRGDLRGRVADLPGARRDKMLAIHAVVRRAAVQLRLLHQLPQVLLMAEDGAVVEMFGEFRTGLVTGLAAPLDSAAAIG